MKAAYVGIALIVLAILAFLIPVLLTSREVASYSSFAGSVTASLQPGQRVDLRGNGSLFALRYNDSSNNLSNLPLKISSNASSQLVQTTRSGYLVLFQVKGGQLYLSIINNYSSPIDLSYKLVEVNSPLVYASGIGVLISVFLFIAGAVILGFSLMRRRVLSPDRR